MRVLRYQCVRVLRITFSEGFNNACTTVPVRARITYYVFLKGSNRFKLQRNKNSH